MMVESIGLDIKCTEHGGKDMVMVTALAKAFLYAEGDAKIALARALLQFLS